MVSVITIHEMHRIDLEKEGKEVASLRSETIRRDFNVVEVDYRIAIRSAILRSMYKVPMADSIVASTAETHECPIVSDDQHFNRIKGLKTKWFEN